MKETSPRPPLTLGIDTGGTFTDLALLDGDGRLWVDKAFSTPDAPDRAVSDVVARLAESQGISTGALLANTGRFAHGTTVSTNALIQRKGARVGLITTRGFEDTLVIARGPIGRVGGLPPSKAMDFIHTEPPPPLVPRALTRGVGERVAATGEVIAPLNEDDVHSAVQDLLDAGIESLAVCLLWSFRHPAHEDHIEAIARGMSPALPISLSSRVAPRLGEFERCVTTCINAFIGPVTERYISALQSDMEQNGLSHPVQVMKSSGGVTLPERIAEEAVTVVNSGPIGGLVAARHLGGLLGHDNIITADMGGTSFDVGLIANGAFEEENGPFLDQGLPVNIPAIKVVTIGAGGGSIAFSDGYRLHVGPESAGADPGPACYGRGGTRPTVTDALVALGIIDPKNFFGGRYALDPDLALRAIGDEVATPLGLKPIEAAAGIFQLVTARMADLIRKVSIESGNDPRRFVLYAYGGASGAHCASFAAQLGIQKVIVPYAAPVFSAFGIALSDILFGHSVSDPIPLAEAGLTTVNARFAELSARVRADMAASGIDPKNSMLRQRIDMRYRGQMNEITLDWPSGAFEEGDAARLRAAFESEYERRFGPGTIRADAPLELISYRVEAIKPTDKPKLAEIERPPESGTAVCARKVYHGNDGWLEAAVYDFASLTPETRIPGPAVIERDSITVWLPPGSAAMMDRYGNLEIEPADGP